MKNEILAGVEALAATDPAAARARLLEALTAARGPLVQAIPDEPGRLLVTFVWITDLPVPALRCSLLPGLEPSIPLRRLRGLPDVRWLEATAADDTCTLYQFQVEPVPFPDFDGPPHDPALGEAYGRALQRVGRADPSNPHRWYPDDPDVPEEHRDSVLTLTGAVEPQWHDEPLRRGTVTTTRFHSRILSNDRDVTVWTPPGRSATGARLPVVVLLDGEAFAGPALGATTVFDNLVASGRVPEFVGVLVHNVDDHSRAHEYPCNPAFADCVADELLPTLRAELGLTDDPTQVVVGGFSYGGLAANWIVLTRPDACGAALSLSASAWWGKRSGSAVEGDLSTGRDDRPAWLVRECPPPPATAPAPRFWLEVGTLENAPIPYADGMTQLDANRLYRDALLERGHRVVEYREVSGAHDLLHWRRVLADGIIALLGPGQP